MIVLVTGGSGSGKSEFAETICMELPAEKDRVAHHDCVFLDLHEPYTKYRGIYYLTKEAENGNKRVTK